MALKLFPNAKEITESMAVYNTVRKHLQKDFPLNDSNITCLVVGDGYKPRTGTLFAFRTNWNVISVDPNMLKNKLTTFETDKINNIDRLSIFKCRIEQLNHLPNLIDSKKVLVVCVHSHAKLTACVEKLKGKEITIISMPCCVPDDLKIEPDISYDDWGIHSEKRRINIYKNIGV